MGRRSLLEVSTHLANAGSHKCLGAMIEKIGMDEFKQAILGPRRFEGMT